MIPHDPTRGWRLVGTAILVPALLLTLSACMVTPIPSFESAQPERPGISTDEAVVAASAPTLDFVTMTDPVDDSFTVSVPRGWDSIAYSTGQFDAHREIVSTVSPDGGTVIFLGDPKVPNYWHPHSATTEVVEFAEVLEYMEVREYVRAESYFEAWTLDKFGALPGFRIDAVETDDEALARLNDQFAAAGLSLPTVHAARVLFGYDSERGRIHGLVSGVTLDLGLTWATVVGGIATNRTVAEYDEMVRAMGASLQTKEEWRQRSAAAHAETQRQQAAFTQQLIAQHNANMAWIQQSAASHQARMEAIWAAGDASMASYYERMDAMDYNQMQFLNYINEEHTVAPVGSPPGGSTSGQTWQVTTGAEVYYVNPTTGQYLGGDINFDDQDILAMGLNPSDYQQVTVVG
jgi:hypothetical protein